MILNVVPVIHAQANTPDILLIMPDQMRGDCLSIAGHPVLRTPTLDNLAQQGVLFRRAYTPVPSCIPARFALLTGLSPQTSGVVGYKEKTVNSPTLPECLSLAGYKTVLVGRYMHQNEESGSLGYETRILGSTYVADDDYDTFLRQAAPASGGIRNLVEEQGLTYNFWQAKPWPLEDDLHPTEWVVREARRIVEQTDGGTRLFLTASFYAPHPPLFPPAEYFNHYMQQQLPGPAMGDWVDQTDLLPGGNQNGHRILLKGEMLHRAQAGYFGLIEHLDAQIALLIDDFKQRSEKNGRNWLIVFTSDHGEMLGDHGFFRKCEPYEGSANIPFIVCASPSLGFEAGKHSMQPVCLEDIMPTLLSLAGAPLPSYLDGVSLLPVLQGNDQSIRPWLHYEHATCYSEEQAFHALTDGHYKYIWRPSDGSEQLFDLDEDIAEINDLSENKNYQTRFLTWRDRLVKLLASRPEGFVQQGRLLPGRPYPPLNEGITLKK
jgi:arylsulfatase